MELAHKELGEDALLVNARLSTPEARNQQIPDDLEPAAKEWIADKIRGANQEQIRSLGATV